MNQSPADLSIPERVNVLGVGVHALDMAAAVHHIERALTMRQRGYVCVASAHGVIEAQHDAKLAAIFDNAMLVTPDGMPLVWLGHLRGFREMRRVFGPELMLAICKRSLANGASHFLYGGKPGVAEELADRLRQLFPGIRIVGTCTPPFRSLTAQEREQVVRSVNRLEPDIIWVGLCTPKQERFMAEYLSLFDTCLMVGVGAAFDFHTGRIKDSPAWVKRSGLQWLHRLLQEPSRLWKRYVFGNCEFVWKVGLQLTRLRRYPLRPQDARPSTM